MDIMYLDFGKAFEITFLINQLFSFLKILF